MSTPMIRCILPLKVAVLQGIISGSPGAPSGCQLELPAEEGSYLSHGIQLRQSAKDVPLIGVDLDLVRYAMLAQNPLEFIGLGDGDHLVLFAVQDQNRGQFGGVGEEVVRQSSKKFSDRGNASILSGEREGKIRAQGEAQQGHLMGIYTRLRSNKCEGIFDGFQPVRKVLFDLAGIDPAMAGAIEKMHDEYMNAERRGLRSIRINSCKRPTGAVHEQHCGRRASPRRAVVVNANRLATAEERGHSVEMRQAQSSIGGRRPAIPQPGNCAVPRTGPPSRTGAGPSPWHAQHRCKQIDLLVSDFLPLDCRVHYGLGGFELHGRS